MIQVRVMTIIVITIYIRVCDGCIVIANSIIVKTVNVRVNLYYHYFDGEMDAMTIEQVPL